MRHPIRKLGPLSLIVPLATLAGCSKEDATGGPSATTASATAASSAPSAAPDSPAPAPLPEPPAALGKLAVPADNPMTPEKVELGRQLFFDKRLSKDGSRACYDCHKNEQGTGGELPTAVGAGGKQLTRHAPIMWNVAYLPKLYWDGRSDSLEAQMKGAWGGGNMGVGKEGLTAKAEELGKLPQYAPQFQKVFGAAATPDSVAQAISAYERTLFCADTAFDKFEAGDKSALSDTQQKGWDLFKGKAACTGCHVAPFFSDAYSTAEGAFHNAGVGFEGKAPDAVDPGRKGATESAEDFGRFKTPSLRNVSRTAPYFHDGSAKTLEDAVRFMAAGGFKNEQLDPKLVDRKLSDEEIGQLVEFLGALECGGRLQPPG